MNDCEKHGHMKLEMKCTACGLILAEVNYTTGCGMRNFLEWISVDKRLPEMGKMVLAVNMNDRAPNILTAYPYSEKDGTITWYGFILVPLQPTHWMYYPELPKC